ncbi:hypothetical protein BU25DRAFT_470593 [Macroventuria anomochaeta]|uniref:Uncharacterized protein n=1 Tax=Macroventuria anomochaeta TaxID=301207 RepID=A0ACB6SEW3_9PLEO|nr:uncharacterized protein BU25DRAFT_470593 [Macroventuria anomochaeta]KAF2632696.1 hypothetical protein BU25DRAFT_470593 [Macroventuria anomochaeta]
MSGCCTPPYTGPATPSPEPPHSASPGVQLATPIMLTQTEVDPNPTVKRFQQDLLILTGFNDNSILHWRPVWFSQNSSTSGMWTLHNPPNIVTERLPNNCKEAQLFTRRMRQIRDPPPQYIKSWDHWKRYCDLCGAPHNFLCEKHVWLMRMGLPRSPDGFLCTPPQYPLYPEPSCPGRYVIAPSIYSTHLHRKFQRIVSASPYVDQDHVECVVVEATGELTIESHEDRSSYHNPGKGHRWSYLPWTTEMEKSCRPLTIKLRLWNVGKGGKTK